MQLTSCKHWLKKLSCIHGSVCLSGSYYCVKLIDKENYLSVRGFYLLKYCLKSLLKLAPVLSSCNQRTHIECKQFFVL